MFTRRKISKELVVVTYDTTNMCIRYSGKKYYGTEREFVKMQEKKLIINKKTLDEFGIELEVIE